MNYGRALGIALFLLSQALRAQDATPIGQELLALRPGVTARAWLAAHPKDKFELYPAGGQHIVQREAWCAVASATLTFGEIQYLRRAYFDVPDAAVLRVPPGSAPHPELVKQCVLSEIELESLRGVEPVLLTQVESAMSSSLGGSKPFQYDIFSGAELSGANSWLKAREWNARMSRWIIAAVPKGGRFQGIALSSAANRNPFVPDDLAPGLAFARQFLPLARMPAAETRRMKELLETPPPSGFGGSGVLPASMESIVSMVALWAASREAPGEAGAARLFAAHEALIHAARFGVLLDNPDFQKPLEAAGADLFHYEPCGCVVYSGNWLIDASQAAPESAPGRQAYLTKLASGFNTGTCGGDADEVVRSGELYLKEHPTSPIRPAVMLHVAHGYAEKVALRYAGPPWGSEEEAGKAFPVALKYYRRVTAVAPGSAEAQEAKRSAWVMLANPAGLPIRWNCLGGD
jgi:hypothetical protein